MAVLLCRLCVRQQLPILLKADTSGKDDPGTMNFTDYGKPVVVKAPAPNEVMDVQELMAS
ncbi:hypothetical protein [Streptomyces sp. NPDC002853]